MDLKLGIGIPLVNRLIDREFFLTFSAMEKPPFILYGPQQEVSSFPKDFAVVRNSLVLQALEDDCSHLIMIDTDQTYPIDTIKKLLSHDVDVVGPVIHRRYPPFAPIMLRGEISKYQYVPYDEMYSNELVEVDATGTGCLCFNMDVFKLMQPPWFEIYDAEDGSPVGEDIRFCSKLRSAGFKIFIDTSIDVGHMATFVIDRAFYSLTRKMWPEKTGAEGPKQERTMEK